MSNSITFKCVCGNPGWVTEGEETNPCPQCGRAYYGEYNPKCLTIDAIEIPPLEEEE